MAVGKGSMERAAKTMTKTKTTTKVIASPVKELAPKKEEGSRSVRIGEEMPVYYY